MKNKVSVLIPQLTDYPDFAQYPLAGKDWGDGIVIRTPNWLGDAVMIFPAIAMLRRLLPEICGIIIVCPQNLSFLFQEMREVSMVVPLKNAHAFPKKNELKKISGLHFGCILMMNNSFRDVLAFRIRRMKPVLGVNIRHRGFLLDVNWKLPKRINQKLNRYHQASVYLAMAKALGAEDWDGTMPHFSFENESISDMKCFSDSFRKIDRPLMILAPGAAYGDAKRWDSKNYNEIAKWWIQKKNGMVLVVGSPNEISVADKVIENIDSGRIENLAGKTNLRDLMILLQKASVCVCNDSGIMHLAASFGTPGVALFGSTDPIATSPVSPKKNWRLLYCKQSCSPCFKRECPLGTKACFSELSPELVEENIDAVLL